MRNKKIDLGIWIMSSMVLLAAVSRFLPHPPNFTPIGGMALFGAAYFSRKGLALIIPFVALWLSNLVLDNVVYAQYYDGFVWFSNPMVFVGFAAIVAMGLFTLRKVNTRNILGSSLLASVLFFLISNFGTWLAGSGVMYTKDFSGLMTCYAAGIPFFWNTLAADLFYVGVLFGSWQYITSRYPTLASKLG
ncbi:MAG: hypothetical protein KDC24_12095 [Saprospiraceae bacterium]|nr:hypothetical protein [Saprospiraceae bacterium]